MVLLVSTIQIVVDHKLDRENGISLAVLGEGTIVDLFLLTIRSCIDHFHEDLIFSMF